MSKKSRFFLWVIIVGLAFIAGVRAYRMYEGYVQAQLEAQPPTITFNNVPVRRLPPQPEEQVYKRWTEEPAQKEFYLENPPLDAEQEKEQARATVASILSDYKNNPEIQSFYADLQQVTGRRDIDLTALSGENLTQLIQQYPQMQQVIAEHAKDPAFAQTIQEIFQNPQFIQSVKVLQGTEDIPPAAGK